MNNTPTTTTESSVKLVESLTWPSKFHTKGLKTSPDGLCCLVSGEDAVLRLYEFNNSMPVFSIQEGGGSIYDYCWYPQMNSQNPSSCVFLSASSGAPVHMFDAFNGTLVASYVSRDHLDNVASALAVTFNASGSHIITTSNNTCNGKLNLFDVQRPSAGPVRAFSATTQGGLFSCVGTNPDHSQTFAVGSYNNTTCIYDERTDDGELMTLEKKAARAAGVTQVQFSADGKFLFTAARKNNEINCWDIRNTTKSIMTYNRVSENNQRIGFDVRNDNYLVTGSQDSQAIIYNINSGEIVSSIQNCSDAVNGVGFIPNDRIVLCTGKRYFKLPADMQDDDSSEDEDEDRNTVQVYSIENLT